MIVKNFLYSKMEPPALNFEKLLEDKEDPQEKLQKLIDLEK